MIENHVGNDTAAYNILHKTKIVNRLSLLSKKNENDDQVTNGVERSSFRHDKPPLIPQGNSKIGLRPGLMKPNVIPRRRNSISPISNQNLLMKNAFTSPEAAMTSNKDH